MIAPSPAPLPSSRLAAANDTTQRLHALINVEAEELIVGALLRQNDWLDQVVDVLDPEDFGDPLMGQVYAVIAAEIAAGRAANALSVAGHFNGSEAYIARNGTRLLAELSSSPLAAMPPRAMAQLVAGLSRRRQLIGSLSAAIDQAGDQSQPIESVVGAADLALSSVAERTQAPIFRDGGDCFEEIVTGLDRPVAGITSGVVAGLDQLAGQIRPTWLGVVAARPGMGKTATAISYLRGVAQSGHHALFASLEMGWETLSLRLVADMCHARGEPVPFDAIINRRGTPEQKRAICRAAEDLKALPFRLIERCHSFSRLRNAVRRHKRQLAMKGQKLDLLVVDYLQLLKPDKRRDNEFQEVSEASLFLKQLAVDEEIAVIALSQLSRGVEQRQDKRPNLADLRSSGQIEQDADFVIFLVSQEYYLRKSEPKEGTLEHENWQREVAAYANELEFICAKHRHGTEGVFRGRFFRAHQAVR